MIKNEKLHNAIMDKNTLFFVLPKTELINMILSGNNAIINSLPVDMKTIFLEKRGLAIENELVEKYINGKIDERHKLILDNCDIRVFQEKISIKM
jgi:hypothetical protein